MKKIFAVVKKEYKVIVKKKSFIIMTILTPVLMPIVKAAGIDPVYFGVLFVINNAIGLITPPVGTVLNTVAGKPARTVMIIHEESLFGTGTANLLARELPGYGFEVKEVIKHANPTRDFNNIVLRMKALNPDIVIPANYYNEYALLVRTMQQQKVQPKAIYSVLGGAASSFKFLKEFPDAANGIIDCNHWFNPKDPRAQALRKRVEAKNLFFTYEIFNTYTAMMYLADAINRAKSTDRAAINAALAGSTFADHFMPYGATKMVDGQNTGAQPLMTQVLGGDIKVIVPREYRQAEPVFPLKS